jgi:hypothetical protein
MTPPHCSFYRGCDSGESLPVMHDKDFSEYELYCDGNNWHHVRCPLKIVFSEEAQKVYAPEAWVWWITDLEVS